jgi:hypothetical protein
MAVSNAEGSLLQFPGLKGVFDVTAPLPPVVQNGIMPFSGVMAEAVQSVAITSRVASDPLLAIGHTGHAGYARKFGGVDMTVDAVLTDNVNVSGAYGFNLNSFRNILSGNATLFTTNGVNGKKVIVSGLYVNQITFTFNQNAESTTSWSFLGNGIKYENYDVAASGVVGFKDFHCISPLMWDEVHITDQFNNVLLTGVQSATITASYNRQDIFQIGQFEPYDRVVVPPYNVSVSLNTLANDVRLTNWWDKFIPTYDPTSDCANSLVIKIKTKSLAEDGTSKDFIIASGLRPTNSTLNAAVGSNSTVALTFEGTALSW